MKTKKKMISSEPNSNTYTFGQCADRLIQIEARADGRIRAHLRQRKDDTWETIEATKYLAPLDATQPITFTLSIDGEGWGTTHVVPIEWDKATYDDGITHLMGLGEPFGLDIDYGTGRRMPGASGSRTIRFTFKDRILTHGDSTEQASWVHSVDLNKCYASAGQTKRYCVTLRVSGDNHANARFDNIDDSNVGTDSPVFAPNKGYSI
jgi:hypothetical protein